MAQFVNNHENQEERKLLQEWLDIAYYNIPEISLYEIEDVLEVECGKYLFIIPYHIDNVHIEPIRTYWVIGEDGKGMIVGYKTYISDIKTSKGERDDSDKEALKNKMQPTIYTLGYHLSKWVTDWVQQFNYYVITKHKKGARFQDISLDIDLSKAKERLYNVLDLYSNYLENGFPEKKNIYCWGCPLKEKCSLYNNIEPLFTSFRDQIWNWTSLLKF